MKNFRKVLALVLVVATLFSFTAMASAKSLSDYTDASSVNYGPAVDILSTLGILNGYEDDSFKPTNTITREEMAKMIAVLANSGADVSTLYATACTFADVAKDHWSASYVAYCAKTGIVAGRSATTFDPKGKVTGLETAKMLLVTIGFNAEKQGYVGSDWKVNVLRDAKNCGLLSGFAASYDVDAAITREEAAQMMLNALQTNVIIGYVSNNIVTITNTAYTSLIANGTLIDASSLSTKNLSLYGNAIVAQDTLLKALYNGRLTCVAAMDCFGRPGNHWTLKNTKGTVVLNGVFFADPMKTSTTTAAAGTVTKALAEEYALGNYKLNLYVDGKLVQTLKDYNKADKDADNLSAWLKDLTGNGVLTEVYVNDTTKVITVVVINTYIGEVAYINKSAKTFTIFDDQNNKYSYSNKGLDFVAGDVILFWLCADGLHTAELATPVTATVTEATTNKFNIDVTTSSFVADGKKYEYAFNFDTYTMWHNNDNQNAHKDACEAEGVIGVDENKYPGTHDLYLDKYGYVMTWERTPVGAEINYAYVVENTGKTGSWTQNGTGEYVRDYTVTLVGMDATPAEKVAVDEYIYDESVKATNGTANRQGSFIEYVDGDVKELSDLAKWVESGYVTEDGDIYDVEDQVVAYGTNKTQYLVRTYNYETGNYEYKSFTGTLDATYSSVVYNAYDENVGSIQYFVDDLGLATYVFVDAIYAASSDKAFVLGYSHSATNDVYAKQIGAYDAYNAIVNGEKALVLYTHTGDLAERTLYAAAFECIGLTDNGAKIYYIASEVTAKTIDAAVGYRDGVIYWKVEGGVKALKTADDCVLTVVFTSKYDNADFVVVNGAENVNNYLEDLAAILDPDNDAFVPVKGYYETTAGKVSAIYLVLDPKG